LNLVKNHSLFTDFDIDLFKVGKHYRLYEKLGAHILNIDNVSGVYFAVYAPAAKSVAVIGNFNYWSGDQHQLNVRWDSSGIWEGFIPGLGKGELYKFKIHSTNGDQVLEKIDPFGNFFEQAPKTASIVWEDDYKWKDKKWMNARAAHNALDAPYAVYEVHLGSWKRKDNGHALDYKELAVDLVDYVKRMNYTHVEMLPVMEHPYEPSWGYQITGYFAPCSRHGIPEDFKYLVDAFHKAGIGVILDWVPSHFPEDVHGLGNFDGTCVFEHPDKRKGFHPDWKSLIFNYERQEVRSFLISNAIFWLDQFHVDGLRVDAVASMLYLDYSREEGEWEPNQFGGNENLDAIEFIKEFNLAVYAAFPDVQTIAEESTNFTGVSKPVHLGGLGFGMKWMMGWMNDTLEYFKLEPIHRQFHQNMISFSMAYAFSENFMLPLSHDEVVHGKNSIIYKMPGDDWQRFANLRLLYTYMFGHVGTKLLFMGNDIAQTSEWNHSASIDWRLLDFEPHQGVQNLIADLNKCYSTEEAFYKYNFDPKGFQWIDYQDHANSVIVYLRKSEKESIIILCNFTPIVRENYRIGVPNTGIWQEILNSDHQKYGGSNVLNRDIHTESIESHGFQDSINVKLAPLSGIFLKLKNS